MENGRSLVRWALGASVVAAMCLYAIVASGTGETSGPIGQARADVIVIDGLKTFGDLEAAPVQFLHDKHTDVVEQTGKDCSACHKKNDRGVQSARFMRLEDVSRQQTTDIYHDNCISCHEETARQGRAAGPTECGGCHARGKILSARRPMGLDKFLHARHAASEAIAPPAGLAVPGDSANCAACHHDFDATARKLVAAKGAEDSCRACHKSAETPLGETVNGKDYAVAVRSFPAAAHQECLGCHVDMAARKLVTGPTKCAGCHGLEKQLAFERPKEIKRMERGQPDAALIMPPVPAKAAADAPATGMAPVAFNHKAHEAANDTCRACHHERIGSCVQCHADKPAAPSPATNTATNAWADPGANVENGGGVLLAQAMHATGSMQSCVGCHAARTAQPQCAGCHTAMPRTELPQESCAKCHKSLDGSAKERLAGLSGDALQKAGREVAADMIAARPVTSGLPGLKDIPETVTIGALADEFQPAKLPHRKIVQALYEGVKESRLAGAFHGDPATLCRGCHHNSPASLTPPRCAGCHGRPFGGDVAGKPGLKGAYHQQCMGCHKAMKLEKPADTKCAECHEKKN
ncbi:MAG: cytochrome C [Desulfovibrionaceae bacterium]|jgi:hypothetical protein|nr:cytochrome C [Desulfovibrionaceae bacterium]